MAGETKRALLLSGSIGMGHDVMAEACRLSLDARGWSTELMDVLQGVVICAVALADAKLRNVVISAVKKA